MRKPVILHLTDDTTPGGVMRVTEFFTRSAALSDIATHKVVRLNRRRWDVDARGADLLVSHMTMNWRNFPSRTRLRAQYPDLPMIHAEHSYTQGFVAQRVFNRTRFFAMLRSGYSLFDHVVAVSRTQRDWMKARNLVSGARLSAIQSAVYLSAFAALPRPQGATRTFGLIGRLESQKGFDIAIRAFRATPGNELKLQVWGEGPQRARLEALAAHDPRISFHGHSDTPARLMSGLDAVLMPSRWEAFGLVACEALAARRKVLVARVDGLNDQVENGATPVRDHSVSAWSNAITRAAQNLDGAPGSGQQNESALKVGSRFEQGWSRLLRRQLAAEASVS
jgi:glycosyltransferase involved in cell wall biosynthesis